MAASLATPGGPDTLSTSIPLARTRSSTELSSASSPVASLSRTEAVLSPLSGSTVLESSKVETSAVLSATSRSIVTRTTNAAAASATDDDDEATSTTATGRVNPKGIAADITTTVDPDTINASSSSSNEDKQGLTTGSIAGIAIGMILAFAIVGLCTWYVRKQLMGRTKKGKEFLRSSDHGDWVSGGGGAAASAGFDEKDGELLDEDENGGNGRIERTMSQRAGNHSIMLPSSTSDGQAGIGAYTRSFPSQPHSSMISSSSSSANDFNNGGMYPAVLAANGGRRNQQHDSMQSQKQYDEMQAALAYPSHMGIQPSSPYHVHPQHYSTMSMPIHQPTAVYYTPQQQQQQLQLQQQQHHQQMLMQQQMNMQATGQAYGGNPLPSIPQQQQQDLYHTPRNSLQPPSSAGIESNTANHSHYESGNNSAFNSPFPESIHDSPETGHIINNNNDSMNAAATTPQIGKHQSIPFIIPAQIPMAGNGGLNRESQRISSLQSGSHVQGLPRSLTMGQGDLSSSATSASPALTGSAMSVAQVQQQEDQKRATHYMAQGVPLPTSPPPQGPLPLPVLAPSQMPMLLPGAATLDKGKGKEVEAENPFLDNTGKIERDDDEGLPYLT